MLPPFAVEWEGGYLDGRGQLWRWWGERTRGVASRQDLKPGRLSWAVSSKPVLGREA